MGKGNVTTEDEVAAKDLIGWSGRGARPGPPPDRPSPRTSALRGAATRLAGGFVFAALLYWFDLRLAAALVIVAVLTITIVSIVSPPIGARIDQAIVFVTAPIGRFISSVMLAAVFFLVITPVSAVLRLFGRDLLEAPGSGAGTTWVVKPSVPDESITRRQFSLEAGASLPGKRGRLSTALTFAAVTVGALVLVLAVDLGVGASYVSVRRVLGSGVDTRASAAALETEEWAGAYFDEFGELESTWQPLLGMVRDDYNGKHINIRDRARATYTSPGTGESAVKVHFYGGSTAWGTGQRDLYTIPSHLSRLAEQSGVPVEVENYGQSGWVIWQELALLQQLLSEGNIPDVAIFYNGYNEVGQQMQELSSSPSYPRAGQLKERLEPPAFTSSFTNLARQYGEYSMIVRIVNLIRPQSGTADSAPELTEARARNAVDVHARAVNVIEHLAESYGFEAVFLWQPSAYTTSSGGDVHISGLDHQGYGAAHRRTAELIEPPIVDLTDALESAGRGVFFDGVHTNERGAALVARAIYPHLSLEGS